MAIVFGEKSRGQGRNECLRSEKNKHKRVAITKLRRRTRPHTQILLLTSTRDSRMKTDRRKVKKEQPVVGGRVWVGKFSIMFMAFENTAWPVEAKSRKADRHDNAVIARGDNYLLLSDSNALVS